jgi:hypothetical protein
MLLLAVKNSSQSTEPQLSAFSIRKHTHQCAGNPQYGYCQTQPATFSGQAGSALHRAPNGPDGAACKSPGIRAMQGASQNILLILQEDTVDVVLLADLKD